MTAVDLRRMKIAVGDVIEREDVLELDEATIGGQRFVFDPPRPTGRLTLSRATTGMVFSLAFEATPRGPCMRCLDEASVQLEIKATEYEATDASPDPDELENPYLRDDVLDVSAWARDAVILALPDKILCAEDCEGLCSSCGRRLAEGSCDCGPPPPDTRWSKLEELRAELSD